LVSQEFHIWWIITSKRKLINIFRFFIFSLVLFNAGGAFAQILEEPGLGATDDCTDISVNYENNSKLSQQEKIELMDKALFHSLNKYEGCQRNRANTAGNGAAGAKNSQAGTNGGSNDGSKGKAEDNASSSSTASSEMSGTETPAEQKMPTNAMHDKANPDSATNKDGIIRLGQKTQIKGSGKIPDDIPPVDNDSVLEAQIRHAAMIETDPVIQEKLWNEYRKYKGLPAKTTQHK